MIAALALALAVAAIEPFSGEPPGAALPSGWRELRIPRVKPAELSLVAEDGVTVLRVRSRAGAGSAAYTLAASAAGTELAWRWKIDRVVDKADLETRAGDDFAARVYVFFDVPVEALPWFDRLKIRVARALHGGDLPTTAICYVWDNRHAPGTSAWSPFTDRVRTIVLESGNARAGGWVEEKRDVAADFREAFGTKTAPRVTGIAAGNDTDQTGESASAWFGDFRLEDRR